VAVTDRDHPSDRDAVMAAHQAFYDAFEARSLRDMEAVWAHDDSVVCTHPGWRSLVGWEDVRASWAALLGNDQHLQFIVTDAVPTVVGEVAWVRASENLLANGELHGSIATLNLFTRRDGRWLMVAHHGSPVLGA
jgi:ketosteroid isomerase-like protein